MIKNNRLRIWFWITELILLVLVGIFFALSWSIDQLKKDINGLKLNLETKKKLYYGCDPQEFIREFKLEIAWFKKKKTELMDKFLVIENYKRELSKEDSPGLFFMQKLKTTELELKKSYPNIGLPEALGFSSQMPADKDVPYLLYELEALVRILKAIRQTSTFHIISITSVLPEQGKDNYSLKVKMQTELDSLRNILDFLAKDPIIFVDRLKITAKQRPVLVVVLTIKPISKKELKG